MTGAAKRVGTSCRVHEVSNVARHPSYSAAHLLKTPFWLPPLKLPPTMGTLLADDVRSDLTSVDEIVANGETLHPDVKIATFPCEIEQRGVSLGKVDAKDVPSRTRVYGEHTFTSNVPAFGKTVDGDFLRRSLEGKAKGPGSGETINSKFTTPRQRWRASAPPTIRNEPSTRCPSQERWSSRLAFIVGGERAYETARPSGPPHELVFRATTVHRTPRRPGCRCRSQSSRWSV